MAVMGTVYVDGMQVRFDVSGGTEVTFSNGDKVVVVPNHADVSMYLIAEGLGYGRQIGQLLRDRVLMHCVLAGAYGGEPWYLLDGQFKNMDRVDMLLAQLNKVGEPAKVRGEDLHAVNTMMAVVRGLGCFDV